MTGPTLAAGTVPVGPMLSMFDPIYVGIDEFGHPVYIRIIYKNLLAAGEPGGGKSGLMNTLTAHAALSAWSRLVLFDGKQVELGMWDDIADEFVGPDLDHAIITLRGSSASWTTATPGCAPTAAARSAPATASPSSPRLRRDRPVLHRAGHQGPARRIHHLVPRPGGPRPRRRHARHRRHPAAHRGHHPQEPARPVRLPRRVPLHLHRQRDIILGDGWSAAGIHRHRHPPSNPGECFLIAEGGIPQRIKVAYLSDADIIALADYAAWTRRTERLTTVTAGPAIAVA